jgi:AcrR family transcriptional regulator
MADGRTSSERPGRPRSERARAAILTAARTLLDDVGFERLTIEQLAASAGVGKQTIYRWWPSKAAVIADAVLSGVISLTPDTVPDTDDIAADLKHWLDSTVDHLGLPEGQALIRALVSAVAADPVAGTALWERVTGPGQDSLRERLESARRSGQIKRDADLLATVDALTSFTLFLVLSRQAITHERAHGLLRVVLGGIAEVSD